MATITSVVTLAAAPVTITSFQLDPSGRILVTVHVDGTAHTFILDTATRHTTVSSDLATALKRTIQEARPGVRTIDDVSLHLLGMELPHQTLQVAAEPIPAEGIVGAELCQRFIVKVDFRARRITIWPASATLDTRHAVVVPADFTGEVPVITATVSAAGVRASAATLVVGLAVAPGDVSFKYSFAAESGLLDSSGDREVPIELRGITAAAIVASARLPREPEQHPAQLSVDGIVSARALTGSWVVFDAQHHRIVLAK